MKKFWARIILTILISTGWTISSQALDVIPVTSFDGTWSSAIYGTGTGSVTIDGSQIKINAQGSGSDYGEVDFSEAGTTGIVGMWATIKVDQANSTNGSSNIYIETYVGKIGNSKIQLLISLKQTNNQNSIWYRVRSTDLSTNQKFVIGQGTFGNDNGGWSIGDSITVAFAKVGNEAWFYVVGYPQLVKIQSLDEVTFYNSAPDIGAWAGPGSSISGTVSNIYLIKE